MPIGYHPSAYGDYLNALVLFEQITGDNPVTSLATEFDPASVASASNALGIAPQIALQLADSAAATVAAQGPVAAVPEPASLALFGVGMTALLTLRRKRRLGAPLLPA